jgi:hypothetical protein
MPKEETAKKPPRNRKQCSKSSITGVAVVVVSEEKETHQ